jgi:predicted RecB family nuclease
MRLIDGRAVYSASDLVGFAACSHRFELERAALARLVNKPVRRDGTIDLIARRGVKHEHRYLDELTRTGATVVTIKRDGPWAEAGEVLRAEASATQEAMTQGADVIYQATFFDGRWLGYADFLVRVDRPSALGDWSYEVVDTKLAHHVKGSAVLQICSYVDQLTRAQGIEPQNLHVVLGGSEHMKQTFPVKDFMAYFRRVKAAFEAAATASEPAFPPVATYPEPVEHCDVCAWLPDCRARRRADDDLSLVAGISARQRRGLKERGTRTRRALAMMDLPAVPPIRGSGDEATLRVRDQARIQVEGEDEGRAKWEFLLPIRRDEQGEFVADRGFLVLPEPSPNDLFFDIEGDPFAFDDGVEYLFGVLEPARSESDDSERSLFHEIWSRDRKGDVTSAAEKRAFEELVDLLIDRLDADPTMHVYHYAAYERTVLGKLAQRHDTREMEVDRILRSGVLVDLYRVVRQGIRASVESYSIKRLEPLYGLEREVELKSANECIVAFEAWLEGTETDDGLIGEAILRGIAGYNRDDVVSTCRLRDWLEDRRSDLQSQLSVALPRPASSPEADAPLPLTPRAARVADVMERLTSPLPEPAADWTADEQATWLLAQLLPWHKREDRAFWWRFFDLCRKTDAELLREREPLGNIDLSEDLGESGRGGRLQRFRFEPQEHACKVGHAVHDPIHKQSTGTVRELDELGLTITLHRTATEVARGLPRSLIPSEHVSTATLEDALLRIGDWVADHGIAADGPYQAARELLRRLPPRVGQSPGEPLRRPGEDPTDASRRLALALDRSTLAVQGPPGTGKTYNAARMILDLVKAGRKVGVTANSHKVIGNVLDEVHAASIEESPAVAVRLGQKTGQDGEPTSEHAVAYITNARAAAALIGDKVDVVGGTPWLWSDPDLADSVHVLIIDEAGQLSLANAIAVSPAAGSLVLVGDPQQLDQPTLGSHPAGAGRSALAHLLDERPTVGDDAGLLLDQTWRLHPKITAFTSEMFYAGDLSSEPSMSRQNLSGVPPATGTGIRWLPVQHADHATDAPEEAAAIRSLLGRLLANGSEWTDRTGEVRLLRLKDIVVVAPYNAHVELIAKSLPAGARVGTVDKFQGQTAIVSIYAMGTSSPELAPRGMEFLYSLNRLNVGTSRARCVAILVASPALLTVNCWTPPQMKLANALARLVEFSLERPNSAPAND